MDIIHVFKALEFATNAHSKQTRDISGEAYIIHPIRVAKMAMNFRQPLEVVQACLLHDVVEDTDTTLGDLSKAGFSNEVVHLVNLVTKDWLKTPTVYTKVELKAFTDKYYSDILDSPKATIIKTLDRIDNLNDFAGGGYTSRAKNYYDKTLTEMYVEFHNKLNLQREHEIRTKFQDSMTKLWNVVYAYRP